MLALLNQLAVSFDLPILDWIQANLQCGFLDTIMPIITLFGDGGIFWIACSLLLFALPKTRKTGLGMLIALVLGLLVCNVTLKPLVGRPRPYTFQEEQFGIHIALLVEGLKDFSFPSGHTIASFEAAGVLLINSKKLGIPAMILAVLIALSRLYLYVHYPTDVIFSVFAGLLFAVIGNAIAQRISLPTGKKGKFEAK
ncbi:MAG: phosphatase PAP2 family protein [Eubacteriales bacterium]|nr:phosphatase PAP2 family protein [Eubacteriales bacterium]